jgi:hypothetical protein
MNPDKHFPHQLLIDLMNPLNRANKDLYMDKFYAAITGEFSDLFLDKNLSGKMNDACSLLKDHYILKEDYEKCAVLNKLLSQTERE